MWTHEARVRRFWTKVDKSGDCWLWRGAKRVSGYGKTRWQRTDVNAHRVAYELAVGPIPEGMFILHSCDRPSCVRPAHLRPGTQADNIQDAIDRGRLQTGDAHRASHYASCARGERHGSKTKPGQVARGDRHGSRTHPERVPRGESSTRAKLTEALVLEIRSRYADGGVSQKALAQEYGVGQMTISRAVRGVNWAHI